MAVLAILVGAWMWWRCRRSSREESHKLEEGEHWLELPASDALSGDSDGKAFLPGAAAALGGCVLAGTFLAKSAGAGLEALLAAGEAVPFVGEVCRGLFALKRHTDEYHDAEEECRRLSVWCVAMMGAFSRLAREAKPDSAATDLLKEAAAAIKGLYNLVVARQQSSGTVGRVVAFWTNAGYLEEAKKAKDQIQRALDALMLTVASKTSADVKLVLSRTERLPAMDEKLDMVLQGIGVIDMKIDRVLKLAERRSKKDARLERRSDNLSHFSIPREKVVCEAVPFAQGASGKVHRARYHNQMVAAKMVSLRNISIEQMRRGHDAFMRELDIICRLSHPYVVRTFGACTDDASELVLVMELAEGGTLRDMLRSERGGALTDPERLQMVSQIAAGMSYLHSREIAHRDLKSLNVLLRKGACKIADFGLSREDDGVTATSTVGVLGTPAWSAPEVLQGKMDSPGAAFKADVYSFGVTIWEIYSCKTPWDGMKPLWIMNEVANNKKSLDISVDWPAKIRALLVSCFKRNPDERPTMERIESDFPETSEQEPGGGGGAFPPGTPFSLSSDLAFSSKSASEVHGALVTVGSGPANIFEVGAGQPLLSTDARAPNRNSGL